MFKAFVIAQLNPVFIYSPNTPALSMRAIAQRARDFIYCVARKGVTGATTEFSELGKYLHLCLKTPARL